MTRNASRDTVGPPAAHKGRRLARRALAVAVAVALLPLTAVQLRPSPAPAAVVAAAAAKPATGGSGSRPLSFEPNAGQDHPAVRFSTRAAGAHVSFTATEMVVALTGQGPGAARSKTASKAPATKVSVLRTSFVGADPAPDVVAGTALGGKVNYLRGPDPKRWVTDVPTYRGVSYPGLYPGIDLAYDGPEGQLKSTYTVAPGADPSAIRWRYEGARSVALDKSGDLRVTLSDEDGGAPAPVVTEKAPEVWQDIDGRRRTVSARYDIGADDSVGFTLGDFDRSEVLVIDPTLVPGSVRVFGGPLFDDYATGIAVDEEGNSYVTGTTSSPPIVAIPIPPAIKNITPGVEITPGFEIKPDLEMKPGHPVTPSYRPLPTEVGLPEAFVIKFGPSGSIVYSTYLGFIGSDDGRQEGIETLETERLLNMYVEELYDASSGRVLPPTDTMSIAVDESGSAYVAGSTKSASFPTTTGAYRERKCLDTAQNQPANAPRCAATSDAFVTKLNPAGSGLVYSTYLGGFHTDVAEGIAVDAFGQAYVTGLTKSDDFPIRSGYQKSKKIGSDAFLTKLNTDGSQLVYSTYLGGDAKDGGTDVAVDPSGAAYVTGFTESWDTTSWNRKFPTHGFPTTDGAFRQKKSQLNRDTFEPGNDGSRDVFVTKMEPDGSALAYSTYLGGRRDDVGRGIAVNTAGQAYVTGWTESDDFHTFPECEGFCGYDDKIFVTKLNAAGSAREYSTALGQALSNSGTTSAEDIAVDPEGYAYVAGHQEVGAVGINSVPYVAALDPSGNLFSETCEKSETLCAKPHAPPKKLYGYALSNDVFSAIATDHPAATTPTRRKAYAAGSIFTPMPFPQHCLDELPKGVPEGVPRPSRVFDEAQKRELRDQLRNSLPSGRLKAELDAVEEAPLPRLPLPQRVLPQEVPQSDRVPEPDTVQPENVRRRVKNQIDPSTLAEGITGSPEILEEGLNDLRPFLECTVDGGYLGYSNTLRRDVLVANYDVGLEPKTYAVPTVVSASPASLGRGASQRDVTIAGTNFIDGATASFSGRGITVHSTRFDDARTLTANVTIVKGDTNVLTGLRDVAVTNPSGTAWVCRGCFSVTATAGAAPTTTPTTKPSTTTPTTTATTPTTTTPTTTDAPATAASERSASTRTGDGYWLAASDGGIFAFGDAVFRGSTGAIKLNRPIVGMAPTPSGNGYWLVGSDGGIFAFGDAVFRGSAGAMKLAQPIVGIAPTRSGRGYWLVGSDGGIFAFGDAAFHGSTGAMKLAQPIVGMAPSPSGKGYRLVGSDGGIFAFGDAVFRGSTGAMKLNKPIVGMAGE